MGLILDTNVFIQVERSHKALSLSQWQAYGKVFISAITASELLVGIHHAASEPIRLRRSRFVESILQQFPILDFNLEIARVHAELFATLNK